MAADLGQKAIVHHSPQHAAQYKLHHLSALGQASSYSRSPRYHSSKAGVHDDASAMLSEACLPLNTNTKLDRQTKPKENSNNSRNFILRSERERGEEESL